MQSDEDMDAEGSDEEDMDAMGSDEEEAEVTDEEMVAESSNNATTSAKRQMEPTLNNPDGDDESDEPLRKKCKSMTLE